MGFLAWIVVGLIAGWLAGQVMKGGGYGVLVDIILGNTGRSPGRMDFRDAGDLAWRRNDRLDHRCVRGGGDFGMDHAPAQEGLSCRTKRNRAPASACWSAIRL